MRIRWITAALLGAALALAGCDVLALPDLTQTPSPPAPAGATVTTPPPAIETPDAEQPASAPEALVLTVWMPETLAPSSETSAGQAFLNQLAAFDEAYPDIQVEVYPKRITGVGGMLSYLRSAPPVAPGVVPDLALMHRDGMVTAAREGLILPLASLLDAAQAADLYPVATQIGSVGDALVGVPYVLEVRHAVYRDTIFSEPPTTFEAVLESPVPFVFPAAPLGSVNNTTLLQYLATGGTLVGEDNAPQLDAAALTRVLDFYAAALEAGVIETSAFQVSDPANTWAAYRERQGGLAVVTSTLYLAGRSEVRNTRPIPIPTVDGQPAAIATGWMWVLTARDPERQTAALTLLEFLMDPSNQGVYTSEAGWLPSQPAAFSLWPEGDSYVPFADELLTAARPLPDAALVAISGVAIQDALEKVLLENMSPVQAASNAAQAVRPEQPGTP